MRHLGRILATLSLAIVPVALGVTPAAADVDDFVITDFHSDFHLSLDENGHAELRTVETIVAQFPDYDQNRGIERAIPTGYDGHPTDLEVESVTDGDGQRLSWHEPDESQEGFFIIRIGDADRYVHGEQTYVITYTQHHVVREFADTGVQEFYWDVNGDQWRVPMSTVSATLHVDDELAAALTGDAACYQGPLGSSQPCTADTGIISRDGVVYEATAAGLGAGENLTIAVAFDRGTVVERPTSPWASPLFYIQLFLGAVAVAFGIGAMVMRRTVFADAPGRPTIVAEYLPPKGSSLIASAIVLGKVKRAVASTLVDLAVRRNIRIIEEPGSGLFGKPSYTLQLQNADGLTGEERQLAQAFLGNSLKYGATKTLTKNDTRLAKEVYTLLQGFKRTADGREYFKKVPVSARLFPAFFGELAAIGAVVLFFLIWGDARDLLLPAVVAGLAALASVVILVVISRRPLTAKGAELRDHLAGLELYITVAEMQRIEMLQTPQGAERTPVDTNDKAVMLKLYERVLPYAVLFNQEGEWSKVLGDYYDEQPPEWYSGNSAFNTAAFATGISSMASVASTSYSGSSSSSSGGSSGGGSSGGGGGGGGGGGW